MRSKRWWWAQLKPTARQLTRIGARRRDRGVSSASEGRRRDVHSGLPRASAGARTVILVGGRFIVGAGVGVAAVAAPLYAAELAPTALRGRFVSAYQFAITIGIFLAYLVDGWLSQNDGWRFMLGASAVPGLLLFGVALIAPKSPRWLMKMNRRAAAAASSA